MYYTEKNFLLQVIPMEIADANINRNDRIVGISEHINNFTLIDTGYAVAISIFRSYLLSSRINNPHVMMISIKRMKKSSITIPKTDREINGTHNSIPVKII